MLGTIFRAYVAVLSVAAVYAGPQAHAQVIVWVSNIALKSGETTEFADVYWINANCKSLLKGTPKVEMLDGPPGVDVEIKQAMVVPRGWSCARAVAGGKLMIRAKIIEDESRSPMTLRITYPTANGPRQRSEVINVSLFP